PCGAAQVTIDRERWQPVTVDVNLQAGDVAGGRAGVHPPHGTLVINSAPPRAPIRINHGVVGSAPEPGDASPHGEVTIKAALKGYQTWNKSVYLKEAETKLDIQLTPKK